MEENGYANHNVIMESRKKLNISGIKDVISFDDETVLVESCMGRITVKGEELHISSFNTESGDLNVTGHINALVYMSDERNQGGFVSRLFR